MRNRYVKFLIIAISFLTSSAVQACYSNLHSENSLNTVLKYYEFDSPEKKEAIKELFQYASITPYGKPENYYCPPLATDNQLAYTILTIVRETQENFTIRNGEQERWEVHSLNWMTQNKERLRHNLKTLGFIEAIKPQQQSVDAVCVLGATTAKMADRIDYVESLIQAGLQTKSIILLAGERYVTKDVDGTEKELTQLAKKLNFPDWRKLTETHLIKDLYSTSALQNRGIMTYLIDTPARNLPRPTTQTTTLELISWLKTHDNIKKIIFVSNQPYVHYQNAIIRSIFEEQKLPHYYEVVGNAVLKLEKMQPVIEGLGSYIWAISPTVLSNMQIKNIDQDIKDSFKELYSKNPLIYSALPPPFRY